MPGHGHYGNGWIPEAEYRFEVKKDPSRKTRTFSANQKKRQQKQLRREQERLAAEQERKEEELRREEELKREQERLEAEQERRERKEQKRREKKKRKEAEQERLEEKRREKKERKEEKKRERQRQEEQRAEIEARIEEEGRRNLEDYLKKREEEIKRKATEDIVSNHIRCYGPSKLKRRQLKEFTGMENVHIIHVDKDPRLLEQLRQHEYDTKAPLNYATLPKHLQDRLMPIYKPGLHVGLFNGRIVLVVKIRHVPRLSHSLRHSLPFQSLERLSGSREKEAPGRVPGHHGLCQSRTSHHNQRGRSPLSCFIRSTHWSSLAARVTIQRNGMFRATSTWAR
jgi:hypothetical protein